TYYNPAGLAWASGLELALGYVRIENHLTTNDADSGVEPVHGLVGGIVAPGTLFGVPFAIGIATFLPDDQLSRVRALKQETPRWILYGDRGSFLVLGGGRGIRPFPWVGVGGGLAFLAATHGSFEVTGRAEVASPYDSQLRHEVNADLTAVRY